MIKHFNSDRIDNIAMAIDEDVYGGNHNLSGREKTERLIEKVQQSTDRLYVDSGMIPVEEVAYLILKVWEFKDRELRSLSRSRGAL